MGFVVGFGCLVALAVTAGVTGLPEQKLSDELQIADIDDDGIEHMEKSQNFEKTACTIMGGQCIKLDDYCPGEMRTGSDWCFRYKRYGCCIPPQPDPCDPLGCVLDGTVYENGCFAEDRCIILQCNNGTWEYYNWDSDCVSCSLNGDGDGYNSYISPYVAHNISGGIITQYDFTDYTGTYAMTQSCTACPAPLGIDIAQDGGCITKLLYKEAGVTIEIRYSYGGADAALLVNDVAYPYTGGMSIDETIQVTATFGTVLIFTSTTYWPEFVDMYIVGSQGLAVYVYFDCFYYCCQVDTVSLAMPSLSDQLYGLCDVLPQEVPPYPEEWTTSCDGATTTDLADFIGNWTLLLSCSAGRKRRALPVPNDEQTFVKRSTNEIEQACEKKTEGPCSVLPSEVCKKLKDACIARMSGSSIPRERSDPSQ